MVIYLLQSMFSYVYMTLRTHCKICWEINFSSCIFFLHTNKKVICFSLNLLAVLVLKTWLGRKWLAENQLLGWLVFVTCLCLETYFDYPLDIWSLILSASRIISFQYCSWIKCALLTEYLFRYLSDTLLFLDKQE